MGIKKAIKRAYEQLSEKNWNKIYWAIDMHGTCLKSNYKSGNYESGNFELINEDVINTLKLIQSLPESVLIMWTSAYTPDLVRLREFFELEGVSFDYSCENPKIRNTETGYFNKKFYFSILLDDKAGFDPDNDWRKIYNFLLKKKSLSLIHNIIDEIEELNSLDNKSIPQRVLKFNEEFGELCAELCKIEGITHKPYDENNLREEMSDSLQCQISLILDVCKARGFSFTEVLETILIKNKKWRSKIPEYKKS